MTVSDAPPSESIRLLRVTSTSTTARFLHAGAALVSPLALALARPPPRGAEAAADRRARPHRRGRERRGDHARELDERVKLAFAAARAAGHAAAAARRARTADPRAHDRRPRAAAVRQGNRAARGRRRARPRDRAHRRGEQAHAAAAARDAREATACRFAKFREDIRNEIVMARLREREVDNKIVVTEGEIDNFIKTQQAQASAQRRVNLSHILVAVPENASPEQIQARRARAEQALAQVKRAPISARSRRRFPTRPTRCRAAAWAGATRAPADAVLRRAAEDEAGRGDRRSCAAPTAFTSCG